MEQAESKLTLSGRRRRFQRVYEAACARLAKLGIPFANDHQCEVYYDDSAVGSPDAPAFSYHHAGKIVLCRPHVVDVSFAEAQVTLVHEITHYWCERFPRAMRRSHVFRVPRAARPVPRRRAGLAADYHWIAYDEENEDYLGTHSQVDPEECLAEFMAHQVVYTPDLRRVRSAAARRRFKACRDILRRLRQAYRGAETEHPLS